jgi:hypothetical protein
MKLSILTTNFAICENSRLCEKSPPSTTARPNHLCINAFWIASARKIATKKIVQPVYAMVDFFVQTRPAFADSYILSSASSSNSGRKQIQRGARFGNPAHWCFLAHLTT